MSEASRSHEALECGHCGHKSRMEIIAIASALDTHDDGDGPPFEAGTAYEVQRCPACKKEVLVAGAWHSGMEGPDDWHPKVVLPEPRDHLARRILEERQLDLECMKRAVEEAKKCVGEGGSLSARPKVAAVVLHEGKIVALGHRGELADGEHAEFTVLEGKCRNVVLTGATVYTTLEPCTTRNAPKIPCADRLIR